MTVSMVGSIRLTFGLVSAAALAILGASCSGGPQKGPPVESFQSPEESAQALIGALKANDHKRLEGMFGADHEDLISSGDEVADQADVTRFVSNYEEKHRIEKVAGGDGVEQAVLHVGKDDWPFPIPVVMDHGRWSFDADAGAEEIIDRRIGRNELNTIQVCLAIVDAELEYVLEDHDGDGIREYAQNFRSSPGKMDGLFWPTKEGEPPSPLGPLAARAYEEGYRKPEDGEPVPYHGYFYRILTSQGPNAPGGAYDYLVGENMVGGFAMIAFPAEYDSSGVMTFLVNHDGAVYQKDLGEGTEKAALAMKSFDPDATWKKVE